VGCSHCAVPLGACQEAGDKLGHCGDQLCHCQARLFKNSNATNWICFISHCWKNAARQETSK